MNNNQNNFFTFTVLISVVTLLALTQTCFANAQDDWDTPDPEPQQQAQHVVFAVEQNINHWIFSSSSTTQGKRKLESRLSLQLNAIESTGGLSKAQVEKLRLAGQGDMERFFREVDRVKKDCKGLNMNGQEFQKIWDKVQPLQSKYKKGIFNDGSLFHKVLQGIIRSDPSGKLQKQENERIKYRHRATIELTVASLELGVPLTDKQRQKFIKLLLEETKPPKQYGQQDQYAVYYLASKIDQKKLRSIFDKAQWRAINRMIRQGKSMESHIKQQGFVP